MSDHLHASSWEMPELTSKISAMNKRIAPKAINYFDAETLVEPVIRIRLMMGIERDLARVCLNTVAKVAVAAGYNDYDREGRRSLMIACRILGLSWTYVSKAISDTRLFGAEKASEVWARFMREPDRRMLGHLYVASRLSDGLVKVGFSTEVEKRVAAVGRESKSPMKLLSIYNATLLHEWAFHRNTPNFGLPAEWYYPDNLPSWLIRHDPTGRAA